MNGLSRGLTLVLGGARSGKSTFAVQAGRRWRGDVWFVATARIDGTDLDLAQRVARHREERPPGWRSIESTDLEGVLHAAPEHTMVIVDCMTLWVGARFDDGFRDPEIIADAMHLATLAAAHAAPVVIVSNEVGLGVHPATEVGRRFRDTLGHVNAELAVKATNTLFFAAGRAVRLDDPWTLLT